MKTRTNKNSRTKRKQRKYSYRGGATAISEIELPPNSIEFFNTLTDSGKKFYLNSLTTAQRDEINNKTNVNEQIQLFAAIMSPAATNITPAATNITPAIAPPAPAATNTAVDNYITKPTEIIHKPNSNTMTIGGRYRRKSHRNKNRRSRRQQSRRQQSRRR